MADDINNWKEELCRKYPNIFQLRNRTYKPGELFYPIVMGFDVGDGWRAIIETLCSTLDHIHKVYGVICIAHQVKEKFAGLRFYYTTDIDPVVLIRKEAWWLNIFKWFYAYERIWWRIPFLDRLRFYYTPASVHIGVKYLRITDDGYKLKHPEYENISEIFGMIDGAVRMAEAMSYKTCEVCGTTEGVKVDNSYYWIVTLCPACTHKRKLEREALKETKNDNAR